MKIKPNRIVYWLSTAILSVVFVGGGIAYILGFEAQQEIMMNLGFPLYFMLFLGAAKLLAVGAVLAPGLPLLKEWAYAGLCFVLMGAFYSHLRAGDPVELTTVPVFVWLTGAVSYLLRPSNRRLAD